MLYPGAEFIESPHHGSRHGNKVRMIVLHYTADGGGAVNWFREPEAYASSHFVAQRNGKIVQMVNLERSAWHAGQRPPRQEVIKPNETSVGIEITNWGAVTKKSGKYVTCADTVLPAADVVEAEGISWQRYPDVQVAAVTELVAWLCQELKIPYRFMFEGQPGFARLGRRYGKVPYYLPSGPEGSHSCLATWRFENNAGICGHCHIATGKDDPGPHLPWELVLGKE